jgi:hypothetical protein
MCSEPEPKQGRVSRRTESKWQHAGGGDLLPTSGVALRASRAYPFSRSAAFRRVGTMTNRGLSKTGRRYHASSTGQRYLATSLKKSSYRHGVAYPYQTDPNNSWVRELLLVGAQRRRSALRSLCPTCFFLGAKPRINSGHDDCAPRVSLGRKGQLKVWH